MYNSKSVLSAWSAYNKNEFVRLNSSSGGVFSALASYFFSISGVVYGVSMSEDCQSAKFIKVTDEEGMKKIRGSKYLQARIGDTFKIVENDLVSGVKVLFSGTGCQINGLKAYLRKEYPNLYCVDVICHGAPSPALWKKYVDSIEKSHQRKLREIEFRCKDESWINYGLKEVYTDNTAVYISKNKDAYMQMFLKNYCLRPSCYECIAKKVKKSDITIGDFWGINEVAPEMNDNKGCSLILVRTNQGLDLFENIKNSLIIKEVSYEDGVRANPSEYQSACKPYQRDSFFTDMNVLSFEKLKKKYLVCSLRKRAKRKIVIIFQKIFDHKD